MPGDGFQLELTRPEYLLALLVIPLLVVFFYRSLVDFSRRQMLTSLIVRSIVSVLLCLTLAGLTLLKPTQELFVVFAVDESLSVDDESKTTADDFIRKAVETAGENQYAILRFAKSPREFETAVPEPPAEIDSNKSTDETDDTDVTAFKPVDPDESLQGTNLQAAIEVAAAGIPPHYVARLVLLTDGNETAGNARRAALSSGLPISTVAMKTRDDPEVQVSAVNVPAQVAQGEPFNVEVIVDSNHDDEVQVEVYEGEHRIISARKKVKKGENKFVFVEQVERPIEFAVRISRPLNDSGDPLDGGFQDTLLDNNIASGLVFAAGKPRVLLIESVPELARNLEWALDEEDIIVDTRPPQGMPDSLADLQNYEVLILSNVSATDLSARKMDVIRTYVSELGGGFIMLGGDQSFGLGGYYKTVVEEVLPVRSDFEKEKEKPSLGMVLVIDKSGSMGGQKIELAKDAARAAVDLLGPKDQIGVLAFDGSPYWVSEMRPLSQKALVMDRIAAIEAGGGTTLYPAMEEAYDALQSTSAKLKHVIILTDGHSTPGDFEGMAQSMAAGRMTVSTVGIGNCDTATLESIAQIGKGRYYFTDDPSSIPQIFAKETMTASKSAINEEPFIPQVIRSTQVLSEINFDEAPFLLGYVVTRPKATSEVILVAESGDPLLVWWRYGLGMSVAFTSDAKSRWAAEWLSWNGFNKFWAQTIRHCMRKSETKGFVVDVKRKGGKAHIQLDSVDPTGRFLNKAETELTLIDPKLTNTKIAMTQTAPGRYEADIDVPDSGAYHLQMNQKHQSQLLYQQSRGLIVGYPDELRLRPPNDELLSEISTSSGGTVNLKPEDVFKNESARAMRATPLWPWLIVAAAIVFLLDVALRRIDFSLIFGRTAHRANLRRG